MRQYVELIDIVLNNGTSKNDRTGIGTISYFGAEKRFDLQKGFPLLWLKKTSFHNIKTELLWFLGSHMNYPEYKHLDRTNIKFLVDNNVNIWNDWPYAEYKKFYAQAGFSDKSLKSAPDENIDLSDLSKKTSPFGTGYLILSPKEFKEKIKEDTAFSDRWGKLGPVYGKQWRDWSGHDQLLNVIEALKNNPDDRGLIVNSWNVVELPQMVLRPCHVMMQWESHKNKEGNRILNLKMTQRSADIFLGVPYNIACYSLLLRIVAKIVNMIPGEFIYSLGDLHIYNNHLEQIKQVKRRWYEEEHFDLPKLKINTDISSLDDLTLSSFSLENYNYYPFIPAPVAV